MADTTNPVADLLRRLLTPITPGGGAGCLTITLLALTPIALTAVVIWA